MPGKPRASGDGNGNGNEVESGKAQQNPKLNSQRTRDLSSEFGISEELELNYNISMPVSSNTSWQP